MLEIKEVLRRREAGASVRRIAREMGMDRKTVGRYVEAIAAAGIGDGTEVDDEVLASLAQAVQGRPAVEPSSVWQALSSQRERIAGWLSQTPPLLLTRVQELLARDGVQVSYSTLRRFVARELGHRRREATVRLPDPPPGEEAQVDFGRMGLIPDEAGRLHKLHVLGALALMVGGGAALVAGLACGGAALATGSQLGSGQAFTLREIDALTARGNALNASAVALDIVGGVALTAGATWTIAGWLKRGRAERRLALAPGWPMPRAGLAKAD